MVLVATSSPLDFLVLVGYENTPPTLFAVLTLHRRTRMNQVLQEVDGV